ncbi:MAG: autotransporter [Solirubrobacteraceae bacterium]
MTTLALVVGASCAASCVAAAGATTFGAGATSSSPAAHAARTLFLYENANLREVHTNNESRINERGTAYGTFTAQLNAYLNVSAERVTAVFTIYPRGGSITGRASARFEVKGHTGYYGGNLTITHGTGAYRHASGKNIGISGTIDRISFALTVKAKGWMRL